MKNIDRGALGATAPSVRGPAESGKRGLPIGAPMSVHSMMGDYVSGDSDLPLLQKNL